MINKFKCKSHMKKNVNLTICYVVYKHNQKFNWDNQQRHM